MRNDDYYSAICWVREFSGCWPVDDYGTELMDSSKYCQPDGKHLQLHKTEINGVADKSTSKHSKLNYGRRPAHIQGSTRLHSSSVRVHPGQDALYFYILILITGLWLPKSWLIRRDISAAGVTHGNTFRQVKITCTRCSNVILASLLLLLLASSQFTTTGHHSLRPSSSFLPSSPVTTIHNICATAAAFIHKNQNILTGTRRNSSSDRSIVQFNQ